MSDVPTSEADLVAYKAAQRKRNLYIGGALLIFVILVFALSIARLSEGMKHYKAKHISMSNVPVASAGASAS